MPDIMPFGAASPAEAAEQPPNFLDKLFAGIINGTVQIPKHVIDATVAAGPPGLRREDMTDIPGSAQPVDPLVKEATQTAMGVMGTAAPFGAGVSKAGEVALGIVPVDAGRAFGIPSKIPDSDTFRRAVANTPGAAVDAEAMTIPLRRNQRPEQAMDDSVRGGVFYLPQGSKDAKYYTGTNHNFAYGGTQPIEGTTAIKAPLFVKGATGGKAPEAAYDSLLGKGSYQDMRTDALRSTGGYGLPQDIKAELVQQFLAKHAPELDGLEYHILENSKKGNQLAYALQEAAVASAARKHGHDAIVGYSTRRGPEKEPFISEVFDTRESHYPNPAGDYQTWPASMFGGKVGELK